MKVSRRNFIQQSGLVTAFANLAPAAVLASDHGAVSVTPDAALRRLMDGNRRFAEGHTASQDHRSRRQELVNGQHPFAAILSCADSRVAPEAVFDQGLGELFVVRVAGNILDTDGLASLEYAVAHLGTTLIYVLGHESCGAVKAALDVRQNHAVLDGHLPELVKPILPAVDTALAQHPADVLAACVRANVVATMQRLAQSGPLVDAMVARRTIAVKGGIYKLGTGRVEQVEA